MSSSSRQPDDDIPSSAPGEEDAVSINPLATWALVLGLLSFPCLMNLLTGIPAIILGVMALREIAGRTGQQRGRGQAMGGIVLGVLGCLALIPLLLAPRALKDILSLTSPAEETNLKLIGIAAHAHHDSMGSFPRAAAYASPEGKPLLSWRVALLPYLEQEGLFREFRLDEAWDGPFNGRLSQEAVRPYQREKQPLEDSGLTHVQAFVGPGTIFEDPLIPGGSHFNAGERPVRGAPRRGIAMTDITDGTSNTILVTMARDPVPWSKPADMRFVPGGPLPQLGAPGEKLIPALMADGSVKFLSPRISEFTLMSAITRNGGEILGPDW